MNNKLKDIRLTEEEVRFLSSPLGLFMLANEMIPAIIKKWWEKSH